MDTTLAPITPEQYLEFDRNAEYKNEYLLGRVVAMPGESFQYNLIAANAGGELGDRISRGSCRVLSSLMRVDTSAGYVYPDVSVVCGTPEFIDGRRDTLTNPTVVVEVLSASTRNKDLGAKTRLYLMLAALSDLIFIEQDKIWIEHWYRSADGGWKSTVLEDAAGVLEIQSLNCSIPVAAIYSGIDWPPAQTL